MSLMEVGIVGEVASVVVIGLGVFYLKKLGFSRGARFLITVGILGIGFFTYGLVAWA